MGNRNSYNGSSSIANLLVVLFQVFVKGCIDIIKRIFDLIGRCMRKLFIFVMCLGLLAIGTSALAEKPLSTRIIWDEYIDSPFVPGK